MSIEAQIAEAGQGAQERAERFTHAIRFTLPISARRALLLVGDALLVSGTVLTAIYLWARVGGRAFDSGFVRARWYWFPVLTILWWFLGRLCDLYDVSVAGKRLETTRRIGAMGLGLFMVYLAVYFLLPRDTLPRLFFLFFMGIALPGATLWRWTYATVFALPSFRHRVLIAGAGWAGRTMAQALAHHDSDDYYVLGFVDDDPEKQETRVASLPVLGSSHDLPTLVRELQVDEVVVAVTHQMEGELFQALMDCRAAGVHVTRMPVLYEQLTRRVPVEHVEQGWVVESMNDLPTLHRPAQWVKRLLDIALGLLGTLIFLVLLPFLALAQVILALYQDRALGQSLGSSGRDRVEQDFTLQAAARQYAELLEQVVAE